MAEKTGPAIIVKNPDPESILRLRFAATSKLGRQHASNGGDLFRFVLQLNRGGGRCWTVLAVRAFVTENEADVGYQGLRQGEPSVREFSGTAAS